MPVSVIDSDGRFPDKQRADVMRCSIENKNLLANRGSIYVGTGNSANIGSTANIAITSKLEPTLNGSAIADDYIIVTNNAADLGLKYIALSEISVGSATNASHIYTTVNGAQGLVSGYREIVITNLASMPSSASNNTIYYVVED